MLHKLAEILIDSADFVALFHHCAKNTVAMEKSSIGK